MRQPSGTLVSLPKSSTISDARSLGARGDGATDNTDIFRRVLDAPGGCLWVPEGTYVTDKLTIGSHQWIMGPGTLKLIDDADDNLIETEGFADLTGGDTTGGPHNFGIFGVILDGNRANQAPGSSYAIAIYGFAYHLDGFTVRNGGVYSEWSTSSALPAGLDSFEAYIANFKIHSNDDVGLHFEGPHDSVISKGYVVRCGALGSGTAKPSINFVGGGATNGTQMDAVHVWGATYDYGCVISGSGLSLGPLCQFEGADISQLRINSSRQRIAGKFFAGGDNYMQASAIEFAAGVNNIDLDIKIEELEGGLDLSAGGVSGLFGRVRAQYVIGVTPASILGSSSLDQHSGLEIITLNPAGVSTGSDFRFPGPIQASNVKTYSLTGNESPDRIDVINPDSAGSARSLANGELTLSFFTPDRDFTAASLMIESRAAGTGASFVKIGLFRVQASDNLLCIARTASDTTILGAVNTMYTRAIVDNGAATPGAMSSVVVQRGLRYAFAVLGTGWSGAPQVGASSSSFNMANLHPMKSAIITGQTDLGPQYTSGINASSTRMWGGLI